MQQDLLDATRLQDYEAATTKPEAPATRASAAPGLLPFSYLPDEDADSVTGRAGLPLLLEAFRGYAGDVLVQQHLQLKQRARGLSEAELVEASPCYKPAASAASTSPWSPIASASARTRCTGTGRRPARMSTIGKSN